MNKIQIPDSSITRTGSKVTRSFRLSFAFLILTTSSFYTTSEASGLVEGRVLLQMKTATSIPEAQSQLNSPDVIIGLMLSSEDRIFEGEFSETINVNTMIAILKTDIDVENADPVYQMELALTPCEDCDPRWWEQWGFDNPNGTHIHMPQAWNITTGSNPTIGGDQVVSAVSDNGFQFDHEDLLENVWVNVQERQGMDGEDDDHNGYTDDVYGMEFFENGPSIPVVSEDIMHGTHVLGIISAVGNNEYHVAGVNWRASTMVVKGYGTTTEGLQAWFYALNMRRLYNRSSVVSHSDCNISRALRA